MKVIKPLRLGVFFRPYENAGEFFLAIGVLAFFRFDVPDQLLPEIPLWKFLPQELGKDAAIDAGMPKPRGEFVVTGSAFAPGGRPQPAVTVRVKVGALDKSLTVVGDRVWRPDGTASSPEVFTQMPLTWERAYGGEGFARNPLGKGHVSPQMPGGTVRPLPNIEDPRRRFRLITDVPEPVGFGAYDPMWPQRLLKAGTYDANWVKERMPGLPDDIDWTYFNTAPGDQQMQGHFVGGEPIEIEHMHPEKPVLSTRLPRMLARSFVNLRTPEGEEFREVPLKLETVHLFPHAERGVLIHRGITRIREDDAGDVLHIIVAGDPVDAPRPLEHYTTVFAQRRDRGKALFYAMRDQDLIPPQPEGAPPVDDPVAEMSALTVSENLIAQNMHRRQMREYEAAVAQIRQQMADPRLAALGVPPAPPLPPLPPPPPASPSLDKLPEIMEQNQQAIDASRTEADQRRADAESEARRQCAERGLDYDAIRKAAEARQGGPPKFRARTELLRMQQAAQQARDAGAPSPELEASLASPEFLQKLYTAEAQTIVGYRLAAHQGPSAQRLEGEEANQVRAGVERIAQTTKFFAGSDLTGADLSGLDLSHADLRGALLECANLSGTILRGADLTEAVLVRADLTDADLSGAKLVSVNLGRAVLTRTRAVGCDLTTAVLHGADLRSTCFAGSLLKQTDFFEAVLSDTDFSEVQAGGVNFLRVSVAGTCWTKAQLVGCNFIECDLTGTDFSGATLTKSVFVEAKGARARFRGAILTNLRVVKDSNFEAADFTGARMDAANLRGTKLTGADFTGVHMNGADFSECDLRGAQLRGIVARESRFERADLTGASLIYADLLMASLQRARLDGADLRWSSLFRGDLARVHLDTATRLDEANLQQVRVTPGRAHGS